MVENLAPGRALDLACGPGRNALYLAERGWQVTAVDASGVAVDILQRRARQRGLAVDARVADLEKGEFEIEPSAYDLVCDLFYLQRDLFPRIQRGVRSGGIVIAIIHMVDETPDVKPMNPAYLLRSGELRAVFAGWRIPHDYEGKPADSAHRRRVAEIVAIRP
jgi:tellurite methyltransferase